MGLVEGGGIVLPATLVTMPGYQFRAVTITSYREDDWTTLPPGVKYLAWANETCPTTGRAHKQAFAYGAGRGKTFHGWKAAFPGDHIEELKGTFAQNEAYCSKEGQLHELGEKPMENGKRRSTEKVLELLEAGERPTKIARSNPNLLETVARYDKFWHKLWLEISMEKMNNEGFKPKQVFMLIGPTGTGKTREVYEQYGFGNVYRAVSNKGDWFDGYNGEPAVIFDECGPGNIMPITQFLTITDGYPLSLPVKGGFVPFRPEAVYFTANVNYIHWWSDPLQEHLLAAKRRVTETRLFKADGSVEYQ